MFAQVKMIAPGIARLPQDAGRVARTRGLLSGTYVETETGIRPVETLQQGDLVQTGARGLQEICMIAQEPLWPSCSDLPRAQWPVRIPAGDCGNTHVLEFLPDQAVILDESLDGDASGSATLPAAALALVLGAYRAPPRHAQLLYKLYFEQDETVSLDGGLLVPCPRQLSTNQHVSSLDFALPLAA